jgi:hypothetical protein
MMNLVVTIAVCGLLIAISGCAANRQARPPSAQSAIPSFQTDEPLQLSMAPEREQHRLIDRVKKVSVPPADFEGEGWRPLFNGNDLAGWTEGNFGGGGELEAGEGILVLGMGQPFTGLRYSNEFPVTNYEIALDAMRVMGSDFFCALTVPVADSFCSLIIGGWGGSLVGISSLNGMDASENETTKFLGFENNRWYRVRMRVTPKRLEAWIDQEKVVDVVTSAKLVTVRPGEIEECKPLGLATWQTAAAYREIHFRPVDGPADPPPKSLY